MLDQFTTQFEKQANTVKSGLALKINGWTANQSQAESSLSEDREDKGAPVFTVGGAQPGALNRGLHTVKEDMHSITHIPYGSAMPASL